MTAFRSDSDDYQRLDYSLLQNGSVTLYYRIEFLAEDTKQLISLGYRLENFDCAVWQTEDDMYSAFADILNFPDYFGRNLNALNDCLCDLNISEEGGIALVFHCYDSFAAKMPKVAWHILDIIEIQSRHYLLFGERLLALVQSDNPQIRFDSLGARSADWNRREWLNASRDL